jgi:hypothetical protein
LSGRRRYPRLDRSEEEVFHRLRINLDLLREHSGKAFGEGEEGYLGEVAGKLRVLVHEGRSNQPLLLGLLDKLDCLDAISITIDGPPIRPPRPPDLPQEIGWAVPGDRLNLRQYMTLAGCAVKLPSTGELCWLSHADAVKLWAEQTGAAHEDWALDERLAAILNYGGMIEVFGLRTHAWLLKSIAGTVLDVGDRFVASWSREGADTRSS